MNTDAIDSAGLRHEDPGIQLDVDLDDPDDVDSNHSSAEGKAGDDLVPERLREATMTEQQRQLIHKSWDLIKNDLDQLGFRHYRHLVQLGGDAIKNMFRHTHLDRQQKMLVHTMKWMLNHGSHREEGLRRLAVYHSHLGITPCMLKLFGESFLSGMRDILGEQFTVEMEAAWQLAYRDIAHVFERETLEIREALQRCTQAEIEVRAKETYAQLREYFQDREGEKFLALSDKEGYLYVSLYERGAAPTAENKLPHDRTKFRKRFTALRGRYLYFYVNPKKPPSNILDLGYSEMMDTAFTENSPSPFSFLITDNTGYPLYFLCSGDADKEGWYEKILQVMNRFAYLKREMPRSQGKLQISILGEEFEPKEFREEDFEVLTLIGRGSFGKVYKVREFSTGKIYAIKSITKSKLKLDSQISDLKSEKSILMHISHPFIVKLHASFQSQTHLFLLFTFLSGGELFYHTQNCDGHFSEKRSAFYIAETALAVSYLHSKKIVHRDLKAENLVLDSEGHLILTDFGFAKTLTDDSHVLRQTCGTLAYMAPEIFLDQVLGCGPEIDWWALGVLLYNMLTGYYPFLRRTAQDTVTAIMHEDLVFPPDVSLSENGRDLVRKLLTKKVQDRMRTLETFQAHPFFEGFDWVKCAARELEPPFKPDPAGRNTKYFKPVAEGTSLASFSHDHDALDFKSFFEIHDEYLHAGADAAKKGTAAALLSLTDIQGLLSAGGRRDSDSPTTVSPAGEPA
eukprot:TRINITY_DN9510_c2_g1_i1.p1 TRINITY_DN9510_c2_g1~~TRINITY_DN9510_c2_g1_i1.p1  ORF type:complete len:739 (+),score=264.32 TRINITY_DN9510_c2_g1_i1:176-2392(+)